MKSAVKKDNRKVPMYVGGEMFIAVLNWIVREGLEMVIFE